jgi:hypothetical protein
MTHVDDLSTGSSSGSKRADTPESKRADSPEVEHGDNPEVKRADSHDSKRNDSPESKRAESQEAVNDVPGAGNDATEAVDDAAEARNDVTEAADDATDTLASPIKDECTLVPDNTEAPIVQSKGKQKKHKVAKPKSALSSSSRTKSTVIDKPVRKRRKVVKWEPKVRLCSIKGTVTHARLKQPASTRRVDDDRDDSTNDEPEVVVQPAFGDNHLPSRYSVIRKLCRLHDELESLQQKGFVILARSRTAAANTPA